MAKKWSEVAVDPSFQALKPVEQEEARQRYFEKVVAPEVPEAERELVKSRFDAKTQPLDTLYSDENFQRMEKGKQLETIKSYMTAKGNLNEYGYAKDSWTPEFVQKNIGPNIMSRTLNPFAQFDPATKYSSAVNDEYDRYASSPETNARRRDVLVKSLGTPMSALEEHVINPVLGNFPETFPNIPERQKQLRTEQAQLDDEQARTPYTAGMQTAVNVGVTLPANAVVRPFQAAAAGAKWFQTGWSLWRGAPAIADAALVSGVTGKYLTPTSNADTPNETPAQAVTASQKQSTANGLEAAKYGAGITAAPKILSGVIGGAKWVKDKVRAIAGSTNAAEQRVSSNMAAEASGAAGKPVGAGELANQVQEGVDAQTRFNTRFQSNVKLNTQQAAQNKGVSNFAAKNASEIDTALTNENNTIPNYKTQGEGNEVELADVIKRSRVQGGEGKADVTVQTAKALGQDPVKFIEDAYKPVDFDDMSALAAKNKLGVKSEELLNKHYDNVNATYGAIDPKSTIVTPSKNVVKATKAGLDDLTEMGVLSKYDSNTISEFLGKKTHTARDLVQFNADLATIKSNIPEDIKYKAIDSLNAIKKEVNAALTNAPDQSVAKGWTDAQTLFTEGRRNIYERPGETLVGNQKPSIFKPVENQAKGAQAPVESEAVGGNVLKNKSTAEDFKRTAQFVEGDAGGKAAQRDLKNAIYTDIREQLGTSPTPEKFDTLVAQKANQIASVDGLDKELAAAKDALVRESKNIETAQNIMGGRDAAQAALKKAVYSPEKMTELVNLARKDASGDALEGLRHMYQKEIEDAAITSVQREGKSVDVAKATDLFNQLYNDTDARKALHALWGVDKNGKAYANSLPTTSPLGQQHQINIYNDKGSELPQVADMFKRVAVIRGESLGKGGSGLATSATEGAAAELTGARTLSIRSVEKVLSALSYKEFNKVAARALADPDYAITILRGYQAASDKSKATQAILDAAMDAVDNVGGFGNAIAMNKDDKKKEPASVVQTKKALSAPVAPKVKESVTPVPEVIPDTKSTAPHDLIKAEADAQGVNSQLAINFASVESRMKHDANNKGIMQITDEGRKAARNLLKDDSLETDSIENNVKAGVALAKDAEKDAKSVLGDSAQEHDAYVVYMLGGGTGKQLLQARNSKARVTDIVPAKSVAGQPIFFRNPKSGKPVSVAKAYQNIKEFYNSKKAK